jgi:nitrite reductase/ring-hydroxylating ferredoxin subunit
VPQPYLWYVHLATENGAEVTRHRIAHVDDLQPGELTCVDAAGVRLCLARLESGYHAIGASCTHEEELLSDGDLLGEEVECPAHGSRFNVVTGAVCSLPATLPVQVYPVSIDGTDVVVEL